MKNLAQSPEVDIELLTEGEKKRKFHLKAGITRSFVITLLLLQAVILGLLVSLNWATTSRLNSINKEIAENTITRQSLEPVSQQVSLVKEKLEVYGQVSGRYLGLVQMLDRLAAILPSEVVLTRLDVNPINGQVTVGGTSNDPNVGYQLHQLISQEARVSNLRISSVVADTGEYRFDMNFIADLSYDGSN